MATFTRVYKQPDGGYYLRKDKNLGTYTSIDRFKVGKVYIKEADKYKFYQGDAIFAILATENGNFYFKTTKDTALDDAQTYKARSSDSSTDLSDSDEAIDSVYKTFSNIYIDNREIGRIICDNRVIWQKARIMLLDLSGARGLQVSYNATTITIVFDAIPNREKLEEFFAASNKDLLLTIDNQSYDVVAAEYVKFASLVKFTVTQFSSYKNTTATNVTVAVKTDDTAQSQVLLFDGRPTTTFTKLDLYKTYIFERPGYPPETREATALDFGYLKLGDGHLLINKSDTGLYIKSYDTAFDVKIYGKN